MVLSGILRMSENQAHWIPDPFHEGLGMRLGLTPAIRYHSD